jgi:hypothetical protein
MKTKIPWLVTQRDFYRYLGRALDACKSGRVVFFYHRPPGNKKPVLVALAPSKDWLDVLAAATTTFHGGKYRKVVLEKQPKLRREI